MNQVRSAKKSKWQFLLQGLLSPSFWFFYFGYYILMHLLVILNAVICNLGLITERLCKVNRFSITDNWEGITYLKPHVNISLFLFFVILIAFVKYRSVPPKESPIDYFNLIFRIFCVILLIFNMYYATIFILLFFIAFFLYRLSVLTYEKIVSRKAFTILIHNKFEISYVICLFAFFAMLEMNKLNLLKATLWQGDNIAYIDCCKEEFNLSGLKLKLKLNSNPLICEYAKKRDFLEQCKLDRPFFYSSVPDFYPSFNQGDSTKIDTPDIKNSEK